MAYNMPSGDRDFAMPPQDSMGNVGNKSGAGQGGKQPPTEPALPNFSKGDALLIPSRDFKHCASCGSVLAPSAPDVCASCERTKAYFGGDSNGPKEMQHDSAPPNLPAVIKY